MFGDGGFHGHSRAVRVGLRNLQEWGDHVLRHVFPCLFALPATLERPHPGAEPAVDRCQIRFAVRGVRLHGRMLIGAVEYRFAVAGGLVAAGGQVVQERLGALPLLRTDGTVQRVGIDPVEIPTRGVELQSGHPMVTRPGHTGGYGVGHRLPGIDHMPLRNRAEGRRERLAHREADAGSRHVGVTREAHVILVADQLLQRRPLVGGAHRNLALAGGTPRVGDRLIRRDALDPLPAADELRRTG